MNEHRPDLHHPADTPQPATDETVIPRSQLTLFGDYELLVEIARGGMGVVYKARQRTLDRIVAVKLILSGEDAAEEELQRFESEAKSAARLDHPGIVPVYGFGRLEGRPYMAMGFVDGPSLSRRLADKGPLSPRDAAALLQQVAEAIDSAHRKNVIHRDLKPGNVLIDADGHPRVTDFGLAKRQDSGHSLTATGQVMGTPAYMAPEQAAGEEVGPAADIYSLGATLYAAMIGKPPFDASSIPELLMQVAEVSPLPPSHVCPAVPKALDAICLKCLEKRPDDRYATAGAMAEDLQRFLNSGRVHAGRQKSKVKLGVRVGLAAVVLVAVGAGVWYGRAGGTKPSVETSTEATVAQPGSSSAAPAVQVDETQLLAALDFAEAALLPSATENIWQYRYADGAAACEQAFREFGFTLSQGDPAELATTLTKRSSEFRESVLCGLELWELCAVAAKQTVILEPLRQAQDALDSVAWRRSLRLARSDTDEKILLQIVRDALADSPSPAQIERLALLIASRSPGTNSEMLSLLRDLLQKFPDSFLANLVMASTLHVIGQAKPTESAAYASEAVLPLRIAAKVRPLFALPHSQLAFVFATLRNYEAAAIEQKQAKNLEHRERDLLNEWRYPQSYPLICAARKAREAQQYPDAIGLIRRALSLQPDDPIGKVELAATLLLNGTDVEAESVLESIATGASENRVAFEALQEVFRVVEASVPSASQTTSVPGGSTRSIERAWNSYGKYRFNLSGETPQLTKVPFAADQAKRHQTAWARYLNVPVEYTNTIGMKFMLIPPGEFVMGASPDEQVRFLAETKAGAEHSTDKYRTDSRSLDLILREGPLRPVILPAPFYLGAAEVTQKEYTTVIGLNPSIFSPQGTTALFAGQNTDRHPVENVTAHDAVSFCRKLSELERLTPYFLGNIDGPFNPIADGYRMTTESEWEYACRAGTNTAWHFGDNADVANEYCWSIENAKMTSPVGELKPNAWGLYDMHGNVWEWCIDRYFSTDYERPQFKDSLGSATDADRVIRGGCWSRHARRLRSAHRDFDAPTVRYNVIGFRVVLSVDAVKAALQTK